MDPVLGRVVVEGEQGIFVVGDLGYRLRPLGSKLGGESLDGFLGLFLVLRTGDLLDGRTCSRSSNRKEK